MQVKLEVKLAAGIDAKEITIEEAQNSNTRWIVLDRQVRNISPWTKKRSSPMIFILCF